MSIALSDNRADRSIPDGSTFGNHAIDRQGSAAFHHYYDATGDGQQMVLIALALLHSIPIHKESYVDMHHENRDQHVDSDAEGGNAAQKSEN